VDLIYLQGYLSNVELNWESPTLARFLNRLAGLARLIVMDRRGSGCSERFTPSDVLPLETQLDDVADVMEAAGSERAVIFGSYDSGVVASLFAATYPESTQALILHASWAAYVWSRDYPWAWADSEMEKEISRIRSEWGSRDYAAVTLQEIAPSIAEDAQELEWFIRYMLLSMGPGAAIAELHRWAETDIREILPTIHVPTMVIHPSVGQSVEESRFIASRISGAQFVEPGSEWLPWAGNQGNQIHAIERFILGLQEEEASLDRVLKTVMFTNIVGSTERATEIGDHAWKVLLERHHATVRALLERFRGSEIDTTGDGFFAAFEGPSRATRCARTIAEAVEALGIEIRAGIHTGECEVMDHKIGGLAVVIGSRIGALAAPSEVLVSQTVKDLMAGSGMEFKRRGNHKLKGVPGEWTLYALA